MRARYWISTGVQNPELHSEGCVARKKRKNKREANSNKMLSNRMVSALVGACAGLNKVCHKTALATC